MKLMLISHFVHLFALVLFFSPITLLCSERTMLTHSTPSLPNKVSSTQTPRPTITPRPLLRTQVPGLKLSGVMAISHSPRNSPRIITVPTEGITLEQRIAILELNLKELESKSQTARVDKAFHSNQFSPHAIGSNDHLHEPASFKPPDFNKSSNDQAWEMIIKEIVKMNQPLTAAALTLLFYVISNKELMTSLISFFNENIKDKLKDLTQQAAWSNICNSFMPYLAKRGKSLNGWMYMGLYAGVDLVSEYLKPLVKKLHKDSSSLLTKQKSFSNRLRYASWLIKTGFTQLIAQSFL